MSKKIQRRKLKPSPWGQNFWKPEIWTNSKDLKDLSLENFNLKNGQEFLIVDKIWPFNNCRFLNLQL